MKAYFEFTAKYVGPFYCFVFLCVVSLCFVSCSQDPKEALAEHLGALTSIINNNMEDPDEILKTVRKYLSENRNEIEKLKRKSAELENNMSDLERESYNKKIEQKLGTVFDEFAEARDEFQKKYPKKSNELHRLLKDIW